MSASDDKLFEKLDRALSLGGDPTLNIVIAILMLVGMRLSLVLA